MHARDIRPLLTGASLNLKFHGISVTFTGIHPPHLKRSDALDVWQEQFAELQYFHLRLRHHDVSILAGDWNYKLHAACDGSEFSILARSFLQEHGYFRSQPAAHTWENHNSSNAIDFVCVRCPDLSPVRDSVRWDCLAILHSDHALIDFRSSQSWCTWCVHLRAVELSLCAANGSLTPTNCRLLRHRWPRTLT